MDPYGHDLLFQQDSASIHVSKRMQEFSHREGIILMTHPPKSPDLNPIENIWRYLKNIVQAGVPKTIDELDQFVHEGFKETITPSRIQCGKDW